MAKFLTLNTHSWIEEEQDKKLNWLAERILQEQYDVICLQEVNQLTESEQAVQAPLYQAVSGSIALHQDNYALCLTEKLSAQGLDYYWSWAYNHIGFDIYHEGVAILSRKPLAPREILVSKVNNPADYRTRKVLLAETEVEGQLLTAASCHLSWWDKGFQSEWSKLQAALLKAETPLLLMGDFNNPADQEGYQTMLASPLNLQDSHTAAAEAVGEATVEGGIAGWDQNQSALKIDYIFTSRRMKAERSAVVFDGQNGPVVSDHFGLEAEVKI
ncbi:Exodeoxyribonuclease III [Streptococcus sp. DD11]|uniref:endonuclease/exonuclease/phosphatase family protein n=1 Tax=Streptococcus sp. DD11 TaxID=1777879 RepID=UPI000799E8A2|nr:endonuclease/exonuclease/phosphatase family protein [Streptococcus sp. DD11]KXT84757.1 Exodeoxyribonuclease III [Streptococcus sp. DD11]